MCNKRRKFDQKWEETKLVSHFWRELHVKKRRAEEEEEGEEQRYGTCMELL